MEEPMDVEALEANIRRLRSNTSHLKQKLDDLDNKEKQQEERALKRQREEVEPEDVMKNKRLKSVVVINDEDQNEPKIVFDAESLPTEERKPTLKTTQQDQARNRRLIGGLLVGTLNRIQKDASKEAQDERSRKREEIVRSIDERVQVSHENLWAKEKEKLQTQRKEYQEKLSDAAKDLEQKEKELQERKKEEYMSFLAGFVKTIAKPEIYFLPAKLDDWTEQVFGIGPKVGGTSANTTQTNNTEEIEIEIN